MHNRIPRQPGRGGGRFHGNFRGGRGPPPPPPNFTMGGEPRNGNGVPPPLNQPGGPRQKGPPPPPAPYMGRGVYRGSFVRAPNIHRAPMGPGRGFSHGPPPPYYHHNQQPAMPPPPPFQPPMPPHQHHHHQGRGSFHGNRSIPPPPPPPPRQGQPLQQQQHPGPPRYPPPNMPQSASFPPWPMVNGHMQQIHHSIAGAPHNIPPPPIAPQPQQYTPAQIDAGWQTFQDQATGRMYYANSLISKTQFEKPDCLVAADKQKAATTTNSITTNAWKEYKDVTTGKTYYSNGTTTTWNKPAELQQAALTKEATEMKDAASSDKPDISSSSSPTKKRPRRQSPTPSTTEFGSKDEAVSAFKGLLIVKDIEPGMKWQEVVKACQSDRRWEACVEVLSTGECKQALAEYQNKRTNELRDLERKERARAKTIFMELLTNVVPTLPGFLPYDSRFGEVRDALVKDERFHAVDEERTRESLFADFCEEYQRSEERNQSNKKRLAHEQYTAFLTEKNESGVLVYSSTWSSFLSSLAEPDLSDERFAVSSELSNQDRQLLFADFVIELQRQEDDKRRRIREATCRAEKEQRDAFVNVLTELSLKGKLVPATRWRVVEEQLSSHPSYAPVKAQNRDGPREVFDDFVTKWNAKYRRERSYLSQIIYPSSKGDELVKEETTYDDFLTGLLERASEQSPDAYKETKAISKEENPVSSARLYFNELSMRAKGMSGPPILRHGSAFRDNDSDSSEDEGEIVEDSLPDIMIN